MKTHGKMSSRRLRLPPRGRLLTTGPVDAVAWYYEPLIGYIIRRRLVWARNAIFERRVVKCLEVGYGSGVFQYELADRVPFSVAVDVHLSGSLIRARLIQDGLRPRLLRADGCVLPFADESFDAVVVLSTLEFVLDAERFLTECVRVLNGRGRLVCVTPRPLPWADTLLRTLVGVNPESDFQGGRERTQRALASALPAARRLRRPAWFPRFLAPYELVVFDRAD